jgi:hypothetical protein
MNGLESNDPFRSAQYSIELILVNQRDIMRWKTLTSEVINKREGDVFGNGWSAPSLFGQRSFKHQPSAPPFPLSCGVANLVFGRITETFSPKYSELDRSGVSEETGFSTPHPALLAELKLRPKDGWSKYFVTADGDPAFSDDPAFLEGVGIVRRDLIEKFANDRDLKVVWRVWVEKDGGLGARQLGARREKFERSDFIGFYFEERGQWQGTLMPFRN